MLATAQLVCAILPQGLWTFAKDRCTHEARRLKTAVELQLEMGKIQKWILLLTLDESAAQIEKGHRGSRQTSPESNVAPAAQVRHQERWRTGGALVEARREKKEKRMKERKKKKRWRALGKQSLMRGRREKPSHCHESDS
ncbi:hypothetical protein JOB18_002954 [Solea senegalensis]|uniref:Uncharacterized protein n=1 Tax=Solea senegalensis TaxID=28829 RepID=A0AAV6S1H2_SOLSE|nr:hypothetical protein JOB18_002954 [Solea senegalensis]